MHSTPTIGLPDGISLTEKHPKICTVLDSLGVDVRVAVAALNQRVLEERGAVGDAAGGRGGTAAALRDAHAHGVPGVRVLMAYLDGLSFGEFLSTRVLGDLREAGRKLSSGWDNEHLVRTSLGFIQKLTEQRLPPDEIREVRYHVGEHLRLVLAETQFSKSPSFKVEIMSMLHKAESLWPALLQDSSLLQLQLLL